MSSARKYRRSIHRGDIKSRLRGNGSSASLLASIARAEASRQTFSRLICRNRCRTPLRTALANSNTLLLNRDTEARGYSITGGVNYGLSGDLTRLSAPFFPRRPTTEVIISDGDIPETRAARSDDRFDRDVRRNGTETSGLGARIGRPDRTRVRERAMRCRFYIEIPISIDRLRKARSHRQSCTDEGLLEVSHEFS